MSKIEKNNNNKENNNNNENSNNSATLGNNQFKGNKATDKAKEVGNKAKNKAKQVLKNPKVKAFIKAHLPLILEIILIIVVIIWLVGLIILFTTLPGLILGKLEELARKFLGRVETIANGSSSVTVTQDDMIEVAQYVQSMGYDLAGYGFGNIEYEEEDKDNEDKDDSEDEEKKDEDGEKKSSTKEIKKIKKNVEGKNYIKEYIMASQASYEQAKSNIWGTVRNLFNDEDSQDWATGMIDIEEGALSLGDYLTSTSDNEDHAVVDRETHQLIVNTRSFVVPNFLLGGKVISSLVLNLATGDGAIKFGDKFRYDLDSWSTRYGRPMELFLALHLSTMMPDLTYKIAANRDFNTKVKINMEPVTLNYTLSVTKDDETITENDIIDRFLRECLTDYSGDVPENYKNGQTGNSYAAVLASMTDAEKSDFFNSVMKQVDDPNGLLSQITNTIWGINYQKAVDDSQGKKGKKVLDTLGGIVNKLNPFDDDASYYIYLYNGDQHINGNQDDWTYEQMNKLAYLIYKGRQGIDNVKWPYIESVTKHWYYNDIQFNSEDNYVYRLARSAKKVLDYESDDDSDPLNKDNIDIKLNGTFSKEGGGVVYQVCEPEATGPNQNIVDIFNGKYYAYDGTVETASKIEMKKAVDEDSGAKTYDFNGQEDIDVDKNVIEGIEKQPVSFGEDHTNALSAFQMLQNMHTEAGDYIYRDLKELVLNLKYFTEDEVKSKVKTLACWPIMTNNKNTTWEIDRDKGEFVTVIKCKASEKDVIAPSVATVDKIEDDSITLKFEDIDDETIELYKYIYSLKDPYTTIEKDVLTGMKIKISNIEVEPTLSVGTKVTRKQKIGTAKKLDGTDTYAIKIVLYNVDKTKVDDIYEYFRQEYNNKYEEIMTNKMNYKTEETEGYDVSDYDGTASSVDSDVVGIDAVTEVRISRDDFINIIDSSSIAGTDFASNAGVIYDTCKSNGINPVWCVGQAMKESGCKKRNSKGSDGGYNYWGIGAFNGSGTQYGYSKMQAAVQSYCDNINERLQGGFDVNKWSGLLKKVDPVHFTGELKTAYDVFPNYACVDGFTETSSDEKLKEQASWVVDKYINGGKNEADGIYYAGIRESTQKMFGEYGI